MKVRVCPQCGKHNAENSFNCSDCGETLSMNTLMEIEEGGKSSGRSALKSILPCFERDLAEILKTTVKEGFEDIVWGNNFTNISDKPPYNFGFFIITSMRLICVYFQPDMNGGYPARPYLNLEKEARSKSVGANVDWLLVGPLLAAVLRGLRQKIAVNYPTSALTPQERASRVVKAYDLRKLASKDLISAWYGEIQLKSVVVKFHPEDEVTLTFLDTDAARKVYESIKAH